MKNLITIMFVLFSLNSWAHIAEGPGQETEPSTDEVKVYRGCFTQLESLGCGHPREDQERFRQCMTTSFQLLESSCQKTMKELYGK